MKLTDHDENERTTAHIPQIVQNTYSNYLTYAFTLAAFVRTAYKKKGGNQQMASIGSVHRLSQTDIHPSTIYDVLYTAVLTTA